NTFWVDPRVSRGDRGRPPPTSARTSSQATPRAAERRSRQSFPVESSSSLSVEGQVQGQHVHPRLAEDAEPPTFDVGLHHFSYRCHFQVSRLRDALDLIEGGRRADVRIEAAARGRDEIHGNGRGVAGIGGAK